MLSNDYVAHLLDMSAAWEPTSKSPFRGGARATGAERWTGTRVGLVFGSNSQRRALPEVHAAEQGAFVEALLAAWIKVLELDRFDLA